MLILAFSNLHNSFHSVLLALVYYYSCMCLNFKKCEFHTLALKALHFNSLHPFQKMPVLNSVGFIWDLRLHISIKILGEITVLVHNLLSE